MGALLRRRILFFLALLMAAAAAHGMAAGRLSTSYYFRSCPRVEQIVSDVVTAKQSANPSTAAGTLRLFFHDCFVSNCDAFVLVSPLSSDRSPECATEINLSLLGDAFDIVARAKIALKATCLGTVSCADILTLAACDLVGVLGGPRFPILHGRRDTLSLQCPLMAKGITAQVLTKDQLHEFWEKLSDLGFGAKLQTFFGMCVFRSYSDFKLSHEL